MIFAALPTPLRRLDDRIRQREMLLALPENTDVLFFGDSTAVQAIFPPTFDQLAGVRSMNLSTYGNMSPISDISFYRTYLEHHPSPRAAFLILGMHSWRHTPEKSLFFQYYPRADLAIDLWRNDVLSLPDALKGVAIATIPSLRHRTAFVQAFDLVREKGWAMHAPMFERETREFLGMHRGYVGQGGEFTTVTPDALDAIHALQADGTTIIAPENIVLLQNFCREAASHGTTLFIAVAPYVDAMTEYAEVRQALDDLAFMLESSFTPDTGCIPVDPYYAMHAEFMQDTTHLNHTGSLLFSAAMAELFLASGK